MENIEMNEEILNNNVETEKCDFENNIEEKKLDYFEKKFEIKLKDPSTFYRIGELLGSGKFGEVKHCIEKFTEKEYAAKIISISTSEDKVNVEREIQIMKNLRHPTLLQIYDAFEWRQEMFMILELIQGGELFERVVDEKFDLTENKCEEFMRAICEGVNYIHSQNIIHLDLKPENILCLNKTGFQIKIIDFGLARPYDSKNDIRVMFGTPEFISPEIIMYEPISLATDMWAVGVICYVLLSGLSPFMGDNDGETFANILRCHYSFKYEEFKEISSDAKDFIEKLLLQDIKKRLTAQQCLSHIWLENQQSKRTATINKKRLRHFIYRRKWQKAVNAVIALQRMGVVFTHGY